jgi:hypothetical protein
MWLAPYIFLINPKPNIEKNIGLDSFVKYKTSGKALFYKIDQTFDIICSPW